jgi:hypothetical protein
MTTTTTTRPLDAARRAILAERAANEEHRRWVRARAYASLTIAGAALLVLLVAATFPTPRHTLLTEPPPGPAPGPTEVLAPVPAAPVVPAPAPDAPPSSAPAAAAATPPPVPARSPAPTAPRPDCRASTDPACGPVEYVPAPQPDEPVTITMTAEPAGPYRAGDTVHLTFTIDDPDATVTRDCVHVAPSSPDVAAATTGSCDTAAACPPPPPRYGTWPPPEPRAGHLVVSYDVVVAGSTPSATVDVSVRSGGPCPSPAADQFGSDAVERFTVR